MTTHERYPFHEDPAVAAALGRLLVRRERPDPESVDAVARRHGVDPVRLETAVRRLGVGEEAGPLPERVDSGTVSRRPAPDWLAGRAPVTRERTAATPPARRRRRYWSPRWDT